MRSRCRQSTKTRAWQIPGIIKEWGRAAYSLTGCWYGALNHSGLGRYCFFCYVWSILCEPLRQEAAFCTICIFNELFKLAFCFFHILFLILETLSFFIAKMCNEHCPLRTGAPSRNPPTHLLQITIFPITVVAKRTCVLFVSTFCLKNGS